MHHQTEKFSFLRTDALDKGAFSELIEKTLSGKKQKGFFGSPLNGKTVGLLFFNSSLRTRTSMIVAVKDLGGNPLVLDVGSGTWSLETEDGVVMDGASPEHIKEAIPVLSRYVDVLGVRCFAGLTDYERDRDDALIQKINELSSVPVINLESAMHHPCQSLADVVTISERLGSIKGKKIVLSWAPHPKPLPMAVANSFAIACSQLGANLCIANPDGFDLDATILEKCERLALKSGGKMLVTHNQREALEGARIIYAKSWGSKDFYGDWDREKALREASSSWIISQKKMLMTDEAFFMHCLPVRRNVVVSDEVLDSSRSLVLEQAENRLHAQKAILSMLWGKT